MRCRRISPQIDLVSCVNVTFPCSHESILHIRKCILQRQIIANWWKSWNLRWCCFVCLILQADLRARVVQDRFKSHAAQGVVHLVVQNRHCQGVVRVRVSVRRCCRFSRLYPFHSSDSAVVGIPRRMIAVLVLYRTTASSTLALLQRVGHWAHHIRSKSTSENDTGGWGQKRSRTSSACSDGTTAD